MLGDARLTLAASPQQFDLIVLDAFSSDAIPTHLLTREALRGYLARLSPHGMILMHISNRHMELPSVVAAVGAAEGLVTFSKADENANQFMTDFHAAALVAVLARNEADLGTLPGSAGWRKVDSRPSSPGPTIIPTSSARSCARSSANWSYLRRCAAVCLANSSSNGPFRSSPHRRRTRRP